MNMEHAGVTVRDMANYLEKSERSVRDMIKNMDDFVNVNGIIRQKTTEDMEDGK